MENRNKYRLTIAVLVGIIILLLLRSCVGGGESCLTPLEEAKLSLLELQQIAAEGGEVDEELVAQLIQEIVDATELAIEDAEENSNLEELQDALEEIESLQAMSLDVFEDLSDIVEGEAVEDVLSEAITVTEDEQEQVNDAIEDTVTAIEEGEETVEVDIETSLDEGDGEADNPVDLDNDGVPDELVDTDGDGVPDAVDYNGDGVADELIDSDGDGLLDSVDYDGDGIADEIIDLDGDGVADELVDEDGDGIPDVFMDSDGDGIPDVGDGLSDGEGDGFVEAPAIFNSTPDAAHEGDTLDVLMTTNANESAINNKIEKEEEAAAEEEVPEAPQADKIKEPKK